MFCHGKLQHWIYYTLVFSCIVNTQTVKKEWRNLMSHLRSLNNIWRTAFDSKVANNQSANLHQSYCHSILMIHYSQWGTCIKYSQVRSFPSLFSFWRTAFLTHFGFPNSSNTNLLFYWSNLRQENNPANKTYSKSPNYNNIPLKQYFKEVIKFQS